MKVNIISEACLSFSGYANTLFSSTNFIKSRLDMKKSGIIKRTSSTTLEIDPPCFQHQKSSWKVGHLETMENTSLNYHPGNMFRKKNNISWLSQLSLFVYFLDYCTINISEMIVIYIYIYIYIYYNNIHITQKVGWYHLWDSPWRAKSELIPTWWDVYRYTILGWNQQLVQKWCNHGTLWAYHGDTRWYETVVGDIMVQHGDILCLGIWNQQCDRVCPQIGCST